MKKTIYSAAFACTLLSTHHAFGQTLAPTFASAYSYLDLGNLSDVPSNYGGVTFLNPNTILLGGAANGGNAKLYAVPVIRTMGHVTSFGAATVFSTATGLGGGGVDGGVAVGPGGVVFYTSYSDNTIGQIKPGSSTADRLINASSLGVASSVGSLTIVPAGQPGAGHLKILSYNANIAYDAMISPDGTGTFDITLNTNVAVGLAGGLEGEVYVPMGSPLFTVPSVLIDEYGSGRISAYSVDFNGDPLPASRQDFLTGLGGVEGAAIDPLTGDFLFATYGSGNHLALVSGFAPVPEPGFSAMAVLAGTMVLRHRRGA